MIDTYKKYVSGTFETYKVGVVRRSSMGSLVDLKPDTHILSKLKTFRNLASLALRGSSGDVLLLIL